jgi:hypothetical protein
MNKRSRKKQTKYEQITVKSLKTIKEQNEKQVNKEKVKHIMHNYVKKS